MEMPAPSRLSSRLEAVLKVIYLLFNEGYSASEGRDLVRDDLCREAIRLGLLLTARPETNRPETHALISLMMLQAARLPARQTTDGALVLLPDQDRSLWDGRLIAGGLRHLAESAAGEKLTIYHLQAEIAAIHATSPDIESTDWKRITGLYDQLQAVDPSPVILLNRAVALSRWNGPAESIRELLAIEDHPALAGYHLLPAVLADLFEKSGDRPGAAAYYRRALERPCTEVESRFILSRIEALGG